MSIIFLRHQWLSMTHTLVLGPFFNEWKMFWKPQLLRTISTGIPNSFVVKWIGSGFFHSGRPPRACKQNQIFLPGSALRACRPIRFRGGFIYFCSNSSGDGTQWKKVERGQEGGQGIDCSICLQPLRLPTSLARMMLSSSNLIAKPTGILDIRVWFVHVEW